MVNGAVVPVIRDDDSREEKRTEKGKTMVVKRKKAIRRIVGKG